MRTLWPVALFLCLSCASAPPPTPRPPVPAPPKKLRPAPKLVAFKLPEGWTRATKGSAVVFAGPDSKLKIYALAVAGPAKAAITKAWKRSPSNFRGQAKQLLTPPTATPPYTKTVVAQYSLAADKIVRQALVHTHAKGQLVLLIEGPLELVKKRAAQLREVGGGIKPAGSAVARLTAKDVVAPSSKQLSDLTEFVKRARQQLKVPGLGFALVRDGKLLASLADGTTQLGGKQKVTSRTHFMIGSITKSFTAMLAGRLVDAKKLSWETPVNKLYPKFQLKKVTEKGPLQFQHLLCACSGVARRDAPLLFEFENANDKTVMRDLNDLTQVTKFGETYQYNNQLVAAAGYVLAAAAGGRRGSLTKRYTRLLNKYVLKPLGMRDTLLNFDRVLGKRRHAYPHSETLKGEIRPVPLKAERFATPYAPAGALWSTVDDFSKFLVALTTEGHPKLTKQLAELWKPRVKTSAKAAYALGWVTSDYRGVAIHGHAGGTFGFVAYFEYIPAANAAFVVLTNGSRGGAILSLVQRRIRALLFGQPDKSEKRLQYIVDRIAKNTAETLKQLSANVPAKRLEQLVGKYDGGELGTVEIRAKDGRALLDTGGLVLEFLPKQSKAHAENYIFTTPPLTGMGFWVEKKDGKPELQFEPNAVRYRLVKK